MIYAVWSNWEELTILDALLVALIAIVIVFLVLSIIILFAYLFQKGIFFVDKKTKILPKKENEILNEDEDAVVATLVASIDFHKETGKDAKVVSIKRIED